jgi:hypothetical protein
MTIEYLCILLRVTRARPMDALVEQPLDEPTILPGRWPARRIDLAVLAVYVLGALWVTVHGWIHPNARVLGLRRGDVLFNEWMLSNASHAVTHLENPFFTTLQNAPNGVNLMTNIGLQLPGVVLTPLTLIAGPTIAYLVLITVNLFATAYAWYFVLSRRVVTSRVAAFVGGLFCAFAPALVSNSNGHPHITAQWLVPFIVWEVLALAAPDRSRWPGVVLGVLITAQILVSEEVLLMTAVGIAAALATYVAFRPKAALAIARPFLSGLGVAAIIAAALCAYPLWMQFFGPLHRTGHPGGPNAYALKVGSIVAYAQQSVAGSVASVRGLTPNGSEQALFFGWPLVALAATIVVWLRREMIVRALAVAGLVGALLSIGTTWSWGTRRPSFPAPYALLQHLPIFDDVVVARFALITTAALGVLLAVAIDRLLAREPGASASGLPLRLIAGGALVAALLPLAPMPLPIAHRPPVPTFITSGDWKAYVPAGHTLVPLPLSNYGAIQWGAAAEVGFAVPQGYFLGPTSPTDLSARWFVMPRPTAALITAVAAGQAPATGTDAQRAQAAADVAYWKADALALPKIGFSPHVLAVVTDLYGTPRSVDDVWLWQIRH